MQLVNLSKDRKIAVEMACAYTFFSRLKGLMFTRQLHSGTGLHINPCPSVHTFFMNYAIDVVYLDQQHVVVAVDHQLEPGKLGRRYKHVVSVVELSAGTAQKTKLEIGDQLKFSYKGEGKV
ncbi:DUF192 domain-containing protein [Aquibacillus sp. 3ASR75-11]|uniref:DUF192 domain-containing protein n=1 Tax=Terrihalobacillus insolitus TaxID=2950438 RepID=A0A9X3WVA1_9BACI|nr:DUF192 domain-containing protein [Terrihalobacillus insolitus]MDC3413652.1 DUF192 domain-containing protein [Terrihalobacillus insolitus]MDC3425473.1 DUF192 domain-containing protein [Terrihalobacillus insolitus]